MRFAWKFPRLAQMPVRSGYLMSRRVCAGMMRGLCRTAWTAARRGVAFDAFRAAPRGGSPEQWAVRYGMGRSARFDTALYGVAGANELARAYAHKCQFFFDLWQSKGGDNYEFGPDDRAAYQEPAAVRLLAETLHGRAFARIEWLRRLWPTLG